jgi:multiple sugar transport system substrate-binding protein
VSGRLLVAALALAALASGCGARESRVTLRFWAMGREGEVVQELLHDFERENPDVRVVAQQIPWVAAHAKLLTAHVGHSTPDVGMLGNTWIPEFAALHAIQPLDPRLRGAALPESAYFPGIWDTNVVDGVVYGIPWYVDTRVLFYRRDLLAAAGYASMPRTWSEWREAMARIKRNSGGKSFGIFLPTNEYTPWIVLGLQAGSPLLRDGGTRGAFSDSAFRRAVHFSLGLFHDGLAPAIQGAAIANLYQEFERGTFAMYITGPWQLGEFQNRLSPAMQSSWDTAPLPGPTGPASGLSLAGGSSLVLYSTTKHPDEAWKLIEFLSRPAQQIRFYHLTGDLPARREAWRDTAFTRAPRQAAFATQLERVVPTPKVPEWEEISVRLQDKMEAAIMGAADPDSAMRALDREVDRILEKRRWLIERARSKAVSARVRP